ncbi:MAG: Integral rane transporter, partial [Modestobacter sp.]|nr:Integral rane transporter [Modestobacter sp.]
PAGDTPWSPQPTGPVDFVPGFGTPVPPPVPAPPAGSTAVTPTGQLPVAGPRATPGNGSGQPAKRLGARLKGGLPGGAAGHRAVFAGLGLGVIGLVLLELGLALDFGNDSLWSVVPTWSAFATVAAVVALLPLVAHWVPRAPRAGTTWRIGLAGVAALAAFWVLVALPLVASDRGFLLTAGLGLAAVALWLAPGRTGAGSGSGPGSSA